MTLKNKHLLIFLTLALFLMPSPFVQAQDAPPEAQLALPMGDVAVPQPDTIATKEPAVHEPQAQADSEPAQTPQKGFDPCPQPEDVINSSPDDLAKVQEEIDRFTLCVARAQLLERLNETSLKSDEAIDSALGLGGAIPGVPSPQQNGMPPLPADSLAGADVTPVTLTKTNAVPDAKSEPAAISSNPDIQSSVETETKNDWSISEVYGSGANIQAKLLSPQGDEVRVREGEKLHDNKGIVVRIAPSGVTIRTGSETKDLEWSRQ